MLQPALHHGEHLCNEVFCCFLAPRDVWTVCLRRCLMGTVNAGFFFASVWLTQACKVVAKPSWFKFACVCGCRSDSVVLTSIIKSAHLRVYLKFRCRHHSLGCWLFTVAALYCHGICLSRGVVITAAFGWTQRCVGGVCNIWVTNMGS